MAELSSVVQDIDGNVSSKRVAAFAALALYGAGFLIDTLTTHKVSEHLADGLMVIVLAGIGSALAERFMPSAKAAKPAEAAP